MNTTKLSQLKVLESPFHKFYVGQEIYDTLHQEWVPYSRRSEYFNTEIEATKYLQIMKDEDE